MPQIRQASSGEYESVLRFLAEAYCVSPDYFPTRYPSWWRNEYTDFSRIWVMAKEDRIESLVRVFPLKLVLGEVTVSAGGIGAVSTLPSARGQGHMHHLMYRAIEEMRDEFCLSVLWGDRHRYRLFGYDRVGSCLTMRVRERGLLKMGVKPMPPRTYYGETALLERIRDCHRSQSFYRIRGDHEDALLYGGPGLKTWVAGEGNHFGYLAFFTDRGERPVAEFGGHPPTVLGLGANLFANGRAPVLTFTFPTRDAPALEYWEAASDWSVEGAAMVKVLHLSSAIQLFRPWLRDNPDAADPALLHLPETEAVERLFGVGRPGAAPFFCWPLDRV